MATEHPLAARFLAGQDLGLPVIDCHGHLGRYALQNIPGSGSPESLVASMDRLGIRVLCMSSHLALSPDWKEGNRVAVEAAERFPGRFAVYLVFNPNSPVRESLDGLEAYRGHPALLGVKLHTTLHQAGAGDARYVPAYEWARDAGKAVLCHTWGVPDVKGIEEMARRFPTVPILVGHSGGAETAAMLEAVRVARECANAYLDLTLSAMFDGVIETFVREAGAEKVLYGSDMPFIDPRANLGRVLMARVPDAAKEKILGATMAAILRQAGVSRP